MSSTFLSEQTVEDLLLMADLSHLANQNMLPPSGALFGLARDFAGICAEIGKRGEDARMRFCCAMKHSQAAQLLYQEKSQ